MFKNIFFPLTITLLTAPFLASYADDNKFFDAAIAVLEADKSQDTALLVDGLKWAKDHPFPEDHLEKVTNFAEAFVLQAISQNIYAIKELGNKFLDRDAIFKKFRAELVHRISQHDTIKEYTWHKVYTWQHAQNYAKQTFIEMMQGMSLEEQQACIYELFTHYGLKPNDYSNDSASFFNDVVQICEFFDPLLSGDALNGGLYISLKDIRRCALIYSSILRAALSQDITHRLFSELLSAEIYHDSMPFVNGFFYHIVDEAISSTTQK